MEPLAAALEGLGLVPSAQVVAIGRLDEPHPALDRRERQLEIAAAVLVVHRELAPALDLARLARLRPQLGRARVVARALGAPTQPQQRGAAHVGGARHTG